jgi:crossover junction endodeoxyribonuclease RusA
MTILFTPTTTALRLPGLPVPPSLNNLYRNAGGGYSHRVLTTAGKAYKAEVGLKAVLAARAAGFAPPPRARLKLTLRLYFKADNRDGDNAIKVLQDAICQALGINDRYVKAWDVTAEVDKKNPRADAVLEVIP